MRMKAYSRNGEKMLTLSFLLLKILMAISVTNIFSISDYFKKKIMKSIRL